MVTDAKKTIIIESSGNIILCLTFIQLSKWLQHIEFDLNYVELILCQLNYGTHYTGDNFALALIFDGFTI